MGNRASVDRTPVDRWKINYIDDTNKVATKKVRDDDLVKVYIRLHGMLDTDTIFIRNPNILVGFASFAQCEILFGDENNSVFDNFVPYSIHGYKYFIPNILLRLDPKPLRNKISAFHNGKEINHIDDFKDNLYDLMNSIINSYPNKTIYFKVLTCMGGEPDTKMYSCLSRTPFVPEYMNMVKVIPFECDYLQDTHYPRGKNISGYLYNIETIPPQNDTLTYGNKKYHYIAERKYYDCIRSEYLKLTGVNNFEIKIGSIVYIPYLDYAVLLKNEEDYPICNDDAKKSNKICIQANVPIVVINEEEHNKLQYTGVKAIVNPRKSFDFSSNIDEKLEDNRDKIITVCNPHIRLDDLDYLTNDNYDIRYIKKLLLHSRNNIEKVPLPSAIGIFINSPNATSDQKKICGEYAKEYAKNNFGRRRSIKKRRRHKK